MQAGGRGFDSHQLHQGWPVFLLVTLFVTREGGDCPHLTNFLEVEVTEENVDGVGAYFFDGVTAFHDVNGGQVKGRYALADA